MRKKYRVILTESERGELQDLIRKGKAAAYRRTHAQVFVLADESPLGPGLSDPEIAERAQVSSRTVARLRERFVEQGLEFSLERQKRNRERECVLDGDQEAQLIALMCSDPPSGHSRWSLRLAADQLIQLQIVETISYETVRGVLKKHQLNLG